MNFKKIPLTLVPIAAALITIGLFVFVVPENSDLISAQGDYYLGQATMYLFFVSVVIDIIRFKKMK